MKSTHDLQMTNYCDVILNLYLMARD